MTRPTAPFVVILFVTAAVISWSAPFQFSTRTTKSMSPKFESCFPINGGGGGFPAESIVLRRGGRASKIVQLKNLGSSVIEVSDAISQCTCLDVSIPGGPIRVSSGGFVALKATADFAGDPHFVGRVEAPVRIQGQNDEVIGAVTIEIEVLK